jgi:thiamine-phosphate pyrophosphorylase
VKGLYVITAEIAHMGRSHIDIARAAISGGAQAIQLREKSASDDIFRIAQEMRELTRQAGVKFIVNDRVDVALAAEADGVHIGQQDMGILEARRMLGSNKIVGISATCVDEAVKAEVQGADYVGVGPIFPTPSKSDAVEPIGCGVLEDIRKRVRIPLVAIGGINAENVEKVLLAGADSIAVISAVSLAEDMVSAARELAQRIAGFAKG